MEGKQPLPAHTTRRSHQICLTNARTSNLRFQKTLNREHVSLLSNIHGVPSTVVHRQLELAIYPQALYTVNGKHAGSAYSASAASLHLLSFVLSRPFLPLAYVIISGSNYMPPNLSTWTYGKDSHQTRNDSSTVMTVLPHSSSYPSLAKRRLDSYWMVHVPLLSPLRDGHKYAKSYEHSPGTQHFPSFLHQPHH